VAFWLQASTQLINFVRISAFAFAPRWLMAFLCSQAGGRASQERPEEGKIRRAVGGKVENFHTVSGDRDRSNPMLGVSGD